MKSIETKSAPAASRPYSQAILANGFLYTSGQIPLNPEAGAIEGQTIEAHAEQAIKNLGEILKAAGSDFSKVVKTTCFLAHISDFTFLSGRCDSFAAAGLCALPLSLHTLLRKVRLRRCSNP